MNKASYDIYLNTHSTGIIHAADCVIEELNGKPQRIGFRYHPNYLLHENAFSIDPKTLPLAAGEILLHCDAGLPGFLDDYLPDSWGKKVLTRLAFYHNKTRLNSNSAIDLLSLMGHRKIGALCIVSKGEMPSYELGLSLEQLAQAEIAAQHIDDEAFKQIDELSLIYLANSGSGVGGARPKALISNEETHYIAKFNRIHTDTFNNARVELACLKIAKKVGINIGNGEVINGVNGREVLLLERFDVAINNVTTNDVTTNDVTTNDVTTNDASHYRSHLISINSLLKDSVTQSDHGFHFSYDAIFKVLQKFSISIEHDAEQLLKIMLFNRAINNLDDHERNFSLIYASNGYQLSPAYDLVPQLVRGQYHVAGFEYQPSPPKPSEIHRFGKVFGLSKTRVASCAESVIDALTHWENIAEECAVTDEETARVKSYFNP